MAITKQKGLKFPKIDYQKKANGRTSFYSATETFTLPVSANWNGNTLLACQLDHLPALAREAVGQTIADPVLTCTNDSSTRTINYKKPDSTEPATGEVYLDIYSGIIQFNSADVSKVFSITYFVKADLIDHNAMNRIWSSGNSYIIGSDSFCDFETLADAISSGVLEDWDSIKLMEDQTTTGLTFTTKVRLNGNNRKIIKSGTATSSRAISFSKDSIFEEIDFSGWSATNDVCLYATSDCAPIITRNKNIGGTKLTNAYDVCSRSITENNLPWDENVGQATTTIVNIAHEYLSRTYIANGSIDLGRPVFLDLADQTKCKHLTAVGPNDIFLGIAAGNQGSGFNVNVSTQGVCNFYTGLTIGAEYFLNLDGTISTVATNSILSLGKALTTGSINLDPKQTREYISKIVTASATITKGNAVFLVGTTNYSNTSMGTYNYRFVGIANNSCNNGEMLELIVSGIVSIPSYSFTERGYVYVNSNGTITQTNSSNITSVTTGALSILRLGFALSSNSFLLNGFKHNIAYSNGIISGTITTNSTNYSDINAHRYTYWGMVKSVQALMSLNFQAGNLLGNVLSFNGVNAGATITFELRALTDNVDRTTYEILATSEFKCSAGGNMDVNLDSLKLAFDSANISSNKVFLSLYWIVSGLSSGDISFATNSMYIKEE